LRRRQQPELAAPHALFGTLRTGARLGARRDTWHHGHTCQENDTQAGRKDAPDAQNIPKKRSRAHEFLRRDNGFTATSPQ
jgi:hypothetical protein